MKKGAVTKSLFHTKGFLFFFLSKEKSLTSFGFRHILYIFPVKSNDNVLRTVENKLKYNNKYKYKQQKI